MYIVTSCVKMSLEEVEKEGRKKEGETRQRDQGQGGLPPPAMGRLAGSESQPPFSQT